MVYGASGSGKTNFLKWYLNTLNLDYIVFARDESEWSSDKFINYDTLLQINFKKINNKTIILDDLGAFKNLKTKVEELFNYGRHNNLQIIYLAHYVKDVLPVVRETIKQIYITISNTDKFFESIIDEYKLNKCILNQLEIYRNQFEYGVIEINTLTKNYKIYNSNYKLVYDTKANLEFDPSDLVHYKSYFFKGQEFDQLKLFLEHHSGEEIEITSKNVAFYFVVYCLQNKIPVNTAKINNYLDRIENDSFKILKEYTEYYNSLNKI